MPRKSPKQRREQDGNIFNDPKLRMRFFIDFDDDDTNTPAVVSATTGGGPAAPPGAPPGPPGGPGGPPGGPGGPPAPAAGDPSYVATGVPGSAEETKFKPLLTEAIKIRVFNASQRATAVSGAIVTLPTTAGAEPMGELDVDYMNLISNFQTPTSGGVSVKLNTTGTKKAQVFGALNLLYPEIEKRIAVKNNIKQITATDVIVDSLNADLSTHLTNSFTAPTLTTRIASYPTDLKTIITDALVAKRTEFIALIEKYILEVYTRSQSTDASVNPRVTKVDKDTVKAFYEKEDQLPQEISNFLTTVLEEPSIYVKLYDMHFPGGLTYDGGHHRNRRSDGRKKRRSDGRKKRRSDGKGRKGKKKPPKYM
jgi:hypothetical protein